MKNATRALLLLEWDDSTHGRKLDTPACPICALKTPRHMPGCALDAALDEAGLFTQTDRDAARTRIRYSSEPTLPDLGDE